MILHVLLTLAVLLLVIYLVYTLVRDYKRSRKIGIGRLLVVLIILIALLGHGCHYLPMCGHGHCC